jgi:hypothetical protein
MVLLLTGCASQIAARQCGDAGYTPGTADDARCSDSVLEERRQAEGIIEREEARDAGDPLAGGDSFAPSP